MNYQEFINGKVRRSNEYGIDVKGDLNPHLFADWQTPIVRWTLKRGRAALFEDCGLGKTIQQLEWANQIQQVTGENVMIHCPVGVRSQTLREAEKFDIPNVYICNDQSEVREGIALTNYEKLHKIDPAGFNAVVLDESSILKGIGGKTRSALNEAWQHARFRLCCTATPAPNDHIELGNHAEFLGVCSASEMLTRFFVHDSGETQKWRLKKHAVKDFWQWVASWAICIAKPSDIGGSDDGFELPRLNIERHYVTPEECNTPEGMLFDTGNISATNIHAQKRASKFARANHAAELALAADEPCVIWCDTNYDADALKEQLPDAVEIRGNDTDSKKESVLAAFAVGEIQTLITKPTIAGFGMNWQHCRKQIFAGLSYSFEQYYQAIRRCWRFGQTETVNVHVIIAETEAAIQSAVARKESDFALMQTGMATAMRGQVGQWFGEDSRLTKYAHETIVIPSWLKENQCTAK